MILSAFGRFFFRLVYCEMRWQIIVVILICALSGYSQNPESMKHRFTNSLVHESSPYLLQHAHNPVNWFPWKPEVLEKAKQENKLLVISIGYAACHWCHVMEEECFEDVEVAQTMNDDFTTPWRLMACR